MPSQQSPCSPLSALEARFRRSLRAAGATREERGTFETLVACYSEPHRRYHTVAHVEACIAWLDWLTAYATDPAEVELALWFHDAVCDPRRADSVQASAELAREQLLRVGVSHRAVARIAQHIAASEQHAPARGDTGLMLDLDLSILGAPPDEYARFERAVRDEYSFLPEATYRMGRCAVLGRFLSRDRVYNTPVLHELLEARARHNLDDAMRLLVANKPTG